MTDEQDKKSKTVILTAEEQSNLRRVYEAAGWQVSFHQDFMQVEKEGWQTDIPYAKIRQFLGAVKVKRS